MSCPDVDSPPEWSVQHASDQSGAKRFRHRTSTGTTFVVAVAADVSEDGYSLRLSTETPTNVRHDYLVDRYESCEAAVSAAESFLPYLTRQLRQDRLSPSDPSINAVQRTIRAFRDDSLLDSLRRSIRRLR